MNERHDPSARRHWERASDRLRQLAGCFVHEQTPLATREILNICRPLIRALVCNMPDHVRRDLTADLAAHAIHVVCNPRTSLADDPLAYIRTALRNEFLRLVRLLRSSGVLDTLLLDHEAVEVLASRGVLDYEMDDLAIRHALATARRKAQTSHQPTDLQIVMVVEVKYLLGCDDRAACKVLDFNAIETNRVCQRMSRQRGISGSYLNQLADEMFGD